LADGCSECRHFEFIMDYVCESVGYCHNRKNESLYYSGGKRKGEGDLRDMLKLKDAKEAAVILEKRQCPFFEGK